MKRILFTMLALLSITAVNAQNWIAPSPNDYTGSTPVYVQVKVNGVPSTSLEVAAFINGDCRADARDATVQTNDGNLYLLRVWGNTEDKGQTITFKVFDPQSGIVFNCSRTTEYTGETVSEVPFVLNIDKPTGVSVTDPINILTTFPDKIDLSQYISFIYQGRDESGQPVDYKPLGESTIETKFTYEWTTPTGGQFNSFTIDGNNILTATQSTLLPGALANTGEEAMLTIRVPQYATIGSATTTIIIDEKLIPVTGISCLIQSVKMNKGESLYDIKELTDAIVITPADASNKNYYFEATEKPEAFNKGVAMLGGTYEVKIISEDNSSIFTTITVNVSAPVEYVRVTQNTFQAAIGDNILDLVTPYVVVGPDDATNKSFYLEIPVEASEAITDNIARKPGKFTLNVVSQDNAELKSEITVVITQIIAPKSIDVEINTNAYDVLRKQVTVIPVNEAGETYTITPADEESRLAFVEEIAIKNGTFRLVVTAVLNPKVTAVVTVNVSTPVSITFPTSLTISKYRDTQFKMTATGDNFDPSLVSFEFTSNNIPKEFGVPTYTSADNGKGLIWNIRSTGTGSVELKVLYNGEYMPRNGAETCYIETPAEVAFNSNGWDWIYAPSTISLLDNQSPSAEYLGKLSIDENNKVIEIRSQTNLLYNDAKYGFIGDITSLEPTDGMYKIKATYEDASNCIFTSLRPYWERNQRKTLEPGYTWIGYTNEWNMTLDELNTVMNSPNEGDQIIGKTNFAEYSNGEWVGADFTLEAGKGYLYYNSSDAPNTFSFDFTPDFSNQINQLRLNSISTQKVPAEQNTSVWEFDASQFADNMAIVAEIEKLENPEDYTIGAFVDGECRGMGKVVKDGKMMINVAGESGEVVSFRLHNESTGEYFDLDTKVNYSQKIGSLKCPLSISSPVMTGISTIVTDEADEETYYDLYGRRVDGNKSTGIHIVKTVQNGKVTVKKVIKK